MRLRWVDAFLQDLRYALRTFAKSPGFTALAIAVLALGIGANTAVFTVVNGVLLRPLPFREPDRLLLVSYNRLSGPFGPNRPALVDRHYLDFVREDRLFEGLASFSGSGVNLSGLGDSVRLPTAEVTPNFFDVLGVGPATGRNFASKDKDRTIVIGDDFWRSRMGADPQALGKTLKLDGVDHTVIGIMPPGFRFPSNAEIWMPIEIRVTPGNSAMRPVLGRLKTGASRQQAQAELESFVRSLPRGSSDRRDAPVARVLPVNELLVSSIREPLLIFAGAVAFVLLIACANVANLSLARAAGRQQEMAVRIALGAGRWRLVRQLLTESTLLALAGGACGILVAMWGVPALLALAPAGRIPRPEMIRIDGWVLAFTMGVSVITGLVFGLAPAWQASRRDPRESLSRGPWTIAGQHEHLRGALVISEIALTLMLLTGAGLMVKSFLRLRAVDPGFRAQGLMTMSVELPSETYRTPLQIRAFHQRVLSDLTRLPGVRAAGAVNWTPLGGMLIMGNFHLDGGEPMPPNYVVDKISVSPEYFRTMGIRLLRGREFSDSDDFTAPGVAVISQSVARRFWPDRDPIGRRLTLEDRPEPDDWLTIVGVVDDVKQQGLVNEPDPAIYQPYVQVKRAGWLRSMTFTLRTDAGSASIFPAMRSVLREVDPDQPMRSMGTMDELVATHTAEPRFQARLLSAFAVLALFLALAGIYGVLAYSVVRRTREIGIRMALGAHTADVLGLVLRRMLLLVGTGVVFGAAGALAVTRVLAKFLFEVTPTDPPTFATVALILVSLALAAAWIPARRASRVDPMVALRYE